MYAVRGEFYRWRSALVREPIPQPRKDATKKIFLSYLNKVSNSHGGGILASTECESTKSFYA